MNGNNWIRPLDKIIPYAEWNSVQKHLRTTWKPVRHSNTAHELHIILEGSCRIELEEREIEVKAGQALIILPHTFHSCRSISDPFLRLTVNFIPHSQDLLANCAVDKDHILFPSNEAMRQVCYDIFNEADKHSSYLVNETLCALFSLLMIHVLRSIRPGQEQQAIQFDNSPAGTIDRYFASFNMAGGHTRKGLSQLLHCSERQLNRILSDLYGMTFQEKRLQARMDYAKFLLRNTDMRIPEISSQVGYSNETSFYKVFKAACNTTPKEFRHDHRQSASLFPDPDADLE